MVRWNDELYKKALALRNEVLRKSAGQTFIKKAPLVEYPAVHLVALVDGEVAGTLFISRKSAKVAQIKQVAVSDQYQGLGIGKKLMQHAEKVAELMGYSVVYLEGRESAWGFYEFLGYQETSATYRNGILNFKHFEKQVSGNSVYYVPQKVYHLAS